MESDSRGQAVVRQKGDQSRVIRVVIVALFVLLVVLPLGLWLAGSQSAKVSRRRALDSLVERGEPLSSQAFADRMRTAPLSPEASELIANYKEQRVLTYEVPDKAPKSAAPMRTALTALGYASEASTSELEDIVRRLLDYDRIGKLPTSPAELRRLEAWLEDIEAPLSLALREQPALRYDGRRTPPGSLLHFRSFVHDFNAALMARTHLGIQAGDYAGALETLTVALALAADLGPPVGFLGQLGTNCQRDVLTTQLAMLESLLDAAPDLDARSALPLVPEGTVREHAIQALIEERALELEQLGLTQDGQLVSDRPSGDLASAAGLSLNWELVTYLDAVAAALDHLRSGSSAGTAAPANPPDLQYLPDPGGLLDVVDGVHTLEQRLAELRLRIAER